MQKSSQSQTSRAPSDILRKGSDGEAAANKAKTDNVGSKRAPSSLFKFRTDEEGEYKSWNHDETGSTNNYIRVTIEREGYPEGFVVCDYIPPEQLLNFVPGIRKLLYESCVVIPDVDCIDEDYVAEVITQCIKASKKGVTSQTLELAPSIGPLPAIKIHCILILFDLTAAAEKLLKTAWQLFKAHELLPEEVMWIWETFGPAHTQSSYVAPFADEYVQLMLWQIVNLMAEGKLNKKIAWQLDVEREPRNFNAAVQTRRHKFGTGAGMRPFYPPSWSLVKARSLAPTFTSSGSVNPVQDVADFYEKTSFKD
ncbi:unnamed protein product [Periconia digitata]|uniref:Uncharacterized protein n=1 Tax=Periconia digitata TaxID=1303443 RepID=A0A9W4XJ62_9PLEO|nr:unnamed protein product [Periconia digitata]